MDPNNQDEDLQNSPEINSNFMCTPVSGENIILAKHDECRMELKNYVKHRQNRQKKTTNKTQTARFEHS